MRDCCSTDAGLISGEVYPEHETETCGLKGFSFWPAPGDLLMMLMQHGFVPRFIYRYSAGHPSSQLRVWIFAEKGEASAKFDGINPLFPNARETLPSLADGPVPSAFHALQPHAASIRNGQ